MIKFDRAKGMIFKADGSILAHSIWAGHGTHANVIADEALHGLGPLPAGIYKIDPPRHSDTLGPFVMNLTQIEGETFGRSLFRIHGAAFGDMNHSSSDGCIIAMRTVREAIWREVQNDPRILVV